MLRTWEKFRAICSSTSPTQKHKLPMSVKNNGYQSANISVSRKKTDLSKQASVWKMELDSDYRVKYHIYSKTLTLARRSKDVMRREASWTASYFKIWKCGEDDQNKSSMRRRNYIYNQHSPKPIELYIKYKQILSLSMLNLWNDFRSQNSTWNIFVCSRGLFLQDVLKG